MTDGNATRLAAVRAILAVTQERQLLSDVLMNPAMGFAGLPPEKRAEAQRLVMETLGRVVPIDAVVAPHMRREPAPMMRAILRLAVAELVDRPQDAHGIVNAAVTLARQDHSAGAAAGFVNAVLRRVSAGPVELAVQKLPGWMRRGLVQSWGKDAVAAMEAAHLAGPTLDVTLRDGAADWAERLGAEVLPTGSLRVRSGVQVSALPGFDEGAWWVQDAAAALPAHVLAPAPGARVLDLCAAPGGKTMQLAAMGADVTALDVSEHRLGRLRANLARTKLAARVVVADMLDWVPDAPFDAILLDAPCSASGTIRRHPDLPFVKTRADVEGLVTLQAALIDRAMMWLKPGGRLVYCSCSIFPAEGEDQISAALARHAGWQLDASAPVPARWQARPGEARILPHHLAEIGGIDGFYIAALTHADR